MKGVATRSEKVQDDPSSHLLQFLAIGIMDTFNIVYEVFHFVEVVQLRSAHD